jgi:hypothetical protein
MALSGSRIVALAAYSCLCGLAPASAWAQSSPSTSNDKTDIVATPVGGAASVSETGLEAQAASAPAAIVRGLFTAMRLDGGYMVARQKIKLSDAEKAQLPASLDGQDEGYGAGRMLEVELGYDITPVFAVEALGGVSLVSGTRSDRVRDLGVYFGGLGLRVSPAFSERWRFVIAAGAGYADAEDAISPAQRGPAAFGNVGVEYYVHVRHFSVALEASMLAPLQPLRIFVGLGPELKYTF